MSAIATARVALIAITAATAALPAITAGARAQTTSERSAPTTSAPFLTLPTISNTDLFSQPSPTANTPLSAQTGSVQLTAFLTDVGPELSRGIVWRVFALAPDNNQPTLISEHRNPSPTLSLPPGTYAINVAFGLAHLTKTLKVTSGVRLREKFVINAGGLKIVTRTAANNLIGAMNAAYDLLTDERDQFGKRRKILSNMRPGRITRLNSGIYQIVSRLGDANAIVASEVTVEAGKLTEATVIHEAAKVTFKLVQRTGGEALADAQWIIMSGTGQVIKETAGALPTHVLAPGAYTISARWGGRLHTRSFAVRSGDNVEVEIVIQ